MNDIDKKKGIIKMQIELSEREIELLLTGIKAGIELVEYKEDEYYEEVVPLKQKLENNLIRKEYNSNEIYERFSW